MYNSLTLGRHGIKFGGRDSKKDLGLILTDADIGSVQLKTVDVSIPYTNRPLTYDFSQICGEPIYQPRKLTFTFALKALTARSWQDRYRKVCEWLIRQPRGELYFDVIRDFHFTARCDRVSVSRMLNDHVGEITAEFTADPLMLSEDFADTPWDIFNFEDNCINQDKIVARNIQSNLTFYSFADRDIIPRLHLRSLNHSGGGEIVLLRLNGVILPPIKRDMDGWFKREDFVVKPGENLLTAWGAYTELEVDLHEEVL